MCQRRTARGDSADGGDRADGGDGNGDAPAAAVAAVCVDTGRLVEAD